MQYLDERFSVIRFYYQHGLNQRLRHNVQELEPYRKDLSRAQSAELFFLKGMSLLRDMDIPDALVAIRQAAAEECHRKFCARIIELLEQRPDLHSPSGKTFRFTRNDNSLVGDLSFLSDGRIAGFNHPNECYWEVSAGILSLLNYRRERTTLLVPHYDSTLLIGPFLMRPVIHRLKEIRHD